MRFIVLCLSNLASFAMNEEQCPQSPSEEVLGAGASEHIAREASD
jgi:hypothetical protein